MNRNTETESLKITTRLVIVKFDPPTGVPMNQLSGLGNLTLKLWERGVYMAG